MRSFSARIQTCAPSRHKRNGRVPWPAPCARPPAPPARFLSHNRPVTTRASMHHGNLELFLIFLIAAVVAVPLFRRLGLGAVLGYLFAGVVMGPFGIRLVTDPSSTLAVSELGVVMLLFVIGLELSPARLWLMRRNVFGIGGLQVAISALLLGVAAALLGMGWKTSLII